MGTISIPQLLQQWALEKLTTEQAIGHILQNLAALQSEQHTLSSALYEIIKQQKAAKSDQQPQ